MSTEQKVDSTYPPQFSKALLDDSIPHLEMLKLGRGALKQFLDYQFKKYEDGGAVSELITERSSFIDQFIKKIWAAYIPENVATLVAVGGYGRGELHPYSDIDLLILCGSLEEHKEDFSKFITLLWDLGFDVGSSVRTIDDCITAGLEDITTATNLLESRWITGDYHAFEHLQNIWNRPGFWESKAFFLGKMDEQSSRHKRFNDTVYQLEPNIKESPGGLRDIQTIYWVAKRHFKANSINELVQRNFISTEEYLELEAAYKFLNRTRFALQHLKKRREERLQFDNQQSISESFGYTDTDEKMAVEQFMSSYYRNVQTVVKLNEILLQHFQEVLFNDQTPEIVSINSRFQLVNQYLDIKHPRIFQKNPTTLLEAFIVLESLPNVKGLRSNAIRAIREHLYLIDDDFRNDPINKALFMEIFRQPKGVNAAVKRMHSYGFLSAYLPVFKKITGLMQFNIFHAYTVDEHSILTIRNLRRFFVDAYTYEFPTAHEIANHLSKPELLFLAGLFHDIAKGRGGSHEVLGAEEALIFAKQHNLSKKDGEMIAWLVLRHLDFSGIAQRKDLSDPEVITYFANLMGDQEHLDYLYLLTVADICATSENVWNDWKNSLFLELYNQTSNALDLSIGVPKNKSKKALKTQEIAKEILSKRGISSSDYKNFWDSLTKSEFFSRQNPQDIARITKKLCHADLTQTNLFLENQTQLGASELMIYMPDRDYLFAHITLTLDKLNVDVVEARVYSTTTKMTLVIFYFLSRETHSFVEESRHAEVLHKIREQLSLPDINIEDIDLPREARRVRCFETPTEINFHKINTHLTELSINTKDIPGLLSKIGCSLKSCNIRLHDAKIHTVGEKAEDVFLISDTQNRAITDAVQKQAFIENLLDLIE
jgi:[protein-PII] uridylyltransferase